MPTKPTSDPGHDAGSSVDELSRLRAALRDVLEGMESVRGYVGDYCAEKWGYDGYIERARAALKDGGATL